MIKFLIIAFLVFLFFRLVAPVLFRFLLGMFIKRSMRNGTFFTNMQQPPRTQPNSTHNGRAKADIKIDDIPNQPDRKDFNGGEYVEYEEVK
ncbi:MAG TPA: DUF4834 family protein [Adhaeribacter sp.]|nr:DUF4834 family protein [Adhaeribacter sp.]